MQTRKEDSGTHWHPHPLISQDFSLFSFSKFKESLFGLMEDKLDFQQVKCIACESGPWTFEIENSEFTLLLSVFSNNILEKTDISRRATLNCRIKYSNIQWLTENVYFSPSCYPSSMEASLLILSLSTQGRQKPISTHSSMVNSQRRR